MRALVAMLVFACLAVGAWFFFDRGDVPPLSVAPARVDAGHAVADAAPAAASIANQTTPVLAATDAVADGRRVVATAPVTGPAADVLVVQFDSNEPIAGAEVLCWPPDLDWRKLPADLQALASKDQDAFMRRVSPPLVSDADGRCRVPLGQQGTRAVAIHGERRAEGWLQKDARQPFVLALRVDCTLRVLVVDAAGKPARGSGVMARRQGGPQPMDFGLGATGADGRVELQHVQQLAGEAKTQPLELVAKMPGGASAPVLVEATAPPPEVVLRLPVGGRVTVHVRDAEGKPIDPTLLGNPIVRLATWAEKPTGSRAETDGLNRDPSSAPIDARGDAVFGTVAFGCHVMADVGYTLRGPIVPGPTLDAPHLELTVRENADDVVLTGVLLDADGRPFAGSAYTVACHYARGMSGQNGMTDGAGRFRIGVGSHPAGQQATVSFDTKMGRSSDPQAVELPPRQLTKGRNDLGEIRLGRHGVLVQGKVTCDWPTEPPPVQLQIERKREGRWQQEWNLQPEWQGTAFTLHGGIAAGTPMRLVVQTNAFLPVAPIEFAAGATDLEITLQKGGSATATFLVDDGLPLERLTFQFRRTEPPSKRDDRAESMERFLQNEPSRSADGRTQRVWQGLQPGRYRLQVLCRGVAEPIAAIDAIEIAEGPCSDPRLAAVDLRGRLRSFEIRATTADGSAVASPDAFVILRSRGEDWCGFHLGRGTVTLLAPAAVDLLVVAKGHRAAFVDGVFDSRTIQLEKAPETRLVLTLPSPLPEGIELRLRLQPRLELPRNAHLQLDTGRGMGVEDFLVEEVLVGADGAALVPVRYPGIHRIDAMVGTGRRGSTSVRDFAPGTITLPTPAGLALRIGETSWTRALEAVRR